VEIHGNHWRLIARYSALLVSGGTPMPKVTVELTTEQVAELLRDLPPGQLRMVLARVADRLEVREWMGLGESGFREWLTEPELYADDRPAR